MKTINYTGSSKLISRIVNLLNRKAPLPLDGNGDPDWGTNGQFLTTDGAGGTTWSSGGGGGDSVSWTQTQVSGDKIAEIDINGTTTNVYAPSNPTVNDATLTITQNGSSLGTFTANASANVTIEVPGGGGGGTYTAGDGIDITNDEISVDTTFTESSARANIDSGDTLSTIWGKIKKFFADLSTVAFSGSYTDLSNKPTIPTVPSLPLSIANGGTEANTRLGAAKNLTNESVSSPGWVVGLTANWAKFGYTTLAELKTAMALNNVNNTADANKSVASATKATQDADGNDIRQKYVNVYNSSNVGASSSVTMNDFAKAGFSMAMIYGATDNPRGSAGWVHALNMCWNKGTNTSWISQLAMDVASGTGMYYRTTSGTIIGRSWIRVIDSNNLESSVSAKGFLKAPNVSEYEIASSTASSHWFVFSGFSAYGSFDILIHTRYAMGVIHVVSDANAYLSPSLGTMLYGSSSDLGIVVSSTQHDRFRLNHGAWCGINMLIFHPDFGGLTVTIS